MPRIDEPPPPEIPAGLEHMLPVFVAEMEKDAARLQELAEAPADDLAEHAHGARVKAAMFGEERLFTLFTRIEQMALSGGDRAELPSLVAQIIERLAQLRVYVASFGSGQA